jgi:hypothetical protein
MAKRTDLIKLDFSKNVLANGTMPENCVIMAGFRAYENGDDYEKFQEITYESLDEFNNDIANTLTILKFSNFYMAEYHMQVYSNSLYNILDFKNSILKIKIRLVLHGFKADLSNLQDIFNMLV